MTLADYIDCPCPSCGALNSIPTYMSRDPYHEHLPAHAVPTGNAAEVLYDPQRWDNHMQRKYQPGEVRCHRCMELLRIVSDPPLPETVAVRLEGMEGE